MCRIFDIHRSNQSSAAGSSLADDHMMLLDAFWRLLEPQCEIVDTACDSRAFLELATNTRPGVIVLDISMPATPIMAP